MLWNIRTPPTISVASTTCCIEAPSLTAATSTAAPLIGQPDTTFTIHDLRQTRPTPDQE